MQRLEPPDLHYLSAAVGWLELGVPAEAEAELDRISTAQQNHPEVLEARWGILAETKRWDSALAVARNLVERVPDNASGWLHLAYALRRAGEGGVKQAWDALLPVYSRFPGEPTIPYNLSCYACQMQQFDEARTWLRRALKIGGKESVKEMALRDPDLEALWNEIREL